MSLKTAKVLHCIALTLIALSVVMVLIAWLVLRRRLMMLAMPFLSNEAVLDAAFVPWGMIIESVFFLILAVVWMIVLMHRPSRSATIVVTTILSVLICAFLLLLHSQLSPLFTRLTGTSGAASLGALSAFTTSAKPLTECFLIPGQILMLLSMGGVCGRDFRSVAENTPQNPR